MGEELTGTDYFGEKMPFDSAIDNATDDSGKQSKFNGKLSEKKRISRLRNYDSLPTVKDQMEISLKVLQLEAESKLTLTQVNGQRRLGPCWESRGTVPSHECEIFVGKLPQTLYEHDIYPLFSTIGKIYELRLMMDFSGMNRGYCFIMYEKPEHAARAVKELDQYEICPGRRIGVVASINNCRLYIGMLPYYISSETVIKTIYEKTGDVEKVAVYRHPNNSRCYALVSYKTHRGAAMGRRQLVPEVVQLFQHDGITVEWADANVSPSNAVRILASLMYYY